MLEGRPVIKLPSAPLLLLLVSPLSLAEPSPLESDSEPEILDTSPIKSITENHTFEAIQFSLAM